MHINVKTCKNVGFKNEQRNWISTRLLQQLTITIIFCIKTHLMSFIHCILGGSVLRFHTALILTALGTWTAQNAMPG